MSVVNAGRIWFGNLRRAQWIKAPAPGMGAGRSGAEYGDILASGGAFGRVSPSTHHRFDMSWPQGDMDEFYWMNDYRNGVYGNGLCYFVDPMFADVNACPPHWANPSLSGSGWPSLIGEGTAPALVNASPYINLVTNPSPAATTGTVVVDTNLVKNPSSETNSTGYYTLPGTTGVAALSRPTDGGIAGTAYTRSTWSTASTVAGGGMAVGHSTNASVERIDVTALSAHTASIWVRPSKAKTLALQALVYNTTPAQVGSTVVGTAVPVEANTWTELRVAFTPGSGGVRLVLRVVDTDATFWSIGDTLDVDAAMVALSSVYPAYVDGAIPAGGDFSYAWTGTAHASTSTRSGAGIVGWTSSAGQIVYASGSGASYVRDGASGTGTVSMYLTGGTAVPVTVNGTSYETGITLLSDHATTLSAWMRPNPTSTTGQIALASVVLTAGVPKTVRWTWTAAGTGYGMAFSEAAGSIGQSIQIKDFMVVKAPYGGAYFDGDTNGTWTGTADASTSLSNVAGPTANNMPIRSATYTLTTQVGTVPDRAMVLLIPPTQVLHVGFSGTSSGAAIRAVPVLANGIESDYVDMTLLSPSGTTRLNASFSGASYTAVKFYITPTALGGGSITLSSAKAIYANIGVSPTLTGDHVEGRGHSGLQFNSSPTISYSHYNDATGKKYASAAITFAEVGSWL